ATDGIRDWPATGLQTCACPISCSWRRRPRWCRAIDRGLVERQQHLAREVHPLAHLAPAIARRQRGRRLQEQVVEIVARLAPDLQDRKRVVHGKGECPTGVGRRE